MALVARVLLHATNWVVFTTSLLSRCRIELTKVLPSAPAVCAAWTPGGGR
jgi:hypothetical protein